MEGGATHNARGEDSSAATAPTSLREPLLPSNSDDDSTATIATNREIALVDGLPWDTSFFLKSLYFLDALGSSTWGRFSAIYYHQHGLNPSHIGLIEGVRSVLPVISMVFWGIVADRFESQKLVWLITKSVSTIVLLGLAAPIIYRSFANILAVSALAQLFVSNGILAAYTLDLLGTEHKMMYGRYRLYASLSWGFGSIIMGWITDHYGFEPNFVLFAALGFLMIFLVAAKIPDTHNEQTQSQEDRSLDLQPGVEPAENDERNQNRTRSNEEETQGGAAGNPLELLWLAMRPRVFIFLLEVVIMGSAMATVERLLFLYLVNDLQASTLLCGWSVGVNVMFELPIFWFAQEIMKYLGHDGMFMVAMLCFVVRVHGYTLLTPSTKNWVLALESMHGVTFACFWVVTTDISKVLVHQTQGAFWKTAIPSSVQMLYSALGVSLGSTIGGWAMNKYGSRTMYNFTARIVAGTLVMHVLGSITCRILARHRINSEYSLPASFLPDYRCHTTQEDTNNSSDNHDGNINTSNSCHLDTDRASGSTLEEASNNHLE